MTADLPDLPHWLGLPAGPGLPAALPLVLGVLLAGLHLSRGDQGDVPVPDTDLANITTSTQTSPPPLLPSHWVWATPVSISPSFSQHFLLFGNQWLILGTLHSPLVTFSPLFPLSVTIMSNCLIISLTLLSPNTLQGKPWLEKLLHSIHSLVELNMMDWHCLSFWAENIFWPGLWSHSAPSRVTVPRLICVKISSIINPRAHWERAVWWRTSGKLYNMNTGRSWLRAHHTGTQDGRPLYLSARFSFPSILTSTVREPWLGHNMSFTRRNNQN